MRQGKWGTALNIVINGRFLSQRATGVQRVAQEFTRALDRLLTRGGYPGTRVRLVVPPDADATILGLKSITVDIQGRGSGHLWEQVSLPRALRDETLLCLGNSAPVIRLLGRHPVAVMLHDQAFRLFPDDYSRAYRLAHGMIGRVLFKRARPLLTVSETERDKLLEANTGLTAELRVAPNGSWTNDRNVSAVPHEAVTSQGYGLYIGSFTSRKNIERVFEAAVRLARERERAFLFVGPPNELSGKLEQAIPPELRKLISFRGYVADDALPDLYARAAYLLYPSLYEASGLPPSEAMTFGCPVVASDLPVLRERCGEAALYCDPYDVASIVGTVLKLTENPRLALELSRLSIARAGLFTWEGQVRLVMKALDIPTSL